MNRKRMTNRPTPYQLSDEERADIEEAIDEVRRGDIADEAEVVALFAQYARQQ